MAKNPSTIIKDSAKDFEQEVYSRITLIETQLKPGIKVELGDSYSVKATFHVRIGGRIMGEEVSILHPIGGKTITECILQEFKGAGWEVQLFRKSTGNSEAIYEFIG